MMIVRLAEPKEKCSVSVTYMFTNNTNADSLCLVFFIYSLSEKVTKMEKCVTLNTKVCKNKCVFKHTVFIFGLRCPGGLAMLDCIRGYAMQEHALLSEFMHRHIKMVRYFVSYGLCGLSLSADNLFGGVGCYCTINKNEVILCY